MTLEISCPLAFRKRLCGDYGWIECATYAKGSPPDPQRYTSPRHRNSLASCIAQADACQLVWSGSDILSTVDLHAWVRPSSPLCHPSSIERIFLFLPNQQNFQAERWSPVLANLGLADSVLADPVLVDPLLVNPLLVDPLLVNPLLVDPVLVDPVFLGPMLLGSGCL